VLALSDGVIAIILTLLVFEIEVPSLGQGESLREAIRQVRPSFVAFLISFVVVAIAWAGHRDLFALISRTNRTLVWLNLLYLLPLCVIPFGASLLARYDRDPTALRMYGLLLLAIAVTRLGIWWYATGRPRLLMAPVAARSRWLGTVIVAVPGVACTVAIAIAERSPTTSLLIFAAVPMLYFFGVTLARTLAPAASAERDFT
jgi:uncharacterized membrane protein